MTYTELNLVSKNTEFTELCILAFVKAATQIRAEVANANTDKRQAFATIVLSGGAIQFAWKMAVVTNFSNQTLLNPFLTSPATAVDPTFDAALSSAVSSVWDGLAGIYPV